MELSKIKEFLQNYLNSVVTPRFLEEPNDDGIESFEVHEILKGSYQPPIIHIFLDTVPVINHPSISTKTKLREVEKDIQGFIRIFAIKFPVRVHLNKRPLFKKGKTYETNI